MLTSFEPLKPYNFTFTILELEDPDSFKLGVSKVNWTHSPRELNVSVRLFEDAPKCKNPWLSHVCRKIKFTGELLILRSSGDPVISYTFHGMRLKNQHMSFDYQMDPMAYRVVETPLLFTYEGKTVK